MFAAAGTGCLGWCLYPFIITLGFRALRGWLLISRRRRRPTGSVFRCRRPILRVFLWPARPACARIVGRVNVFGAGLAAFVGRYNSFGLLGWDIADTPVASSFIVWIGDGGIGVGVNSASRAIHILDRFV